MEGFTPPDEGNTVATTLDFMPPQRMITPLGMAVEKAERTDLEGSPTEVRVSFLVGVPPGILTEEITFRIDDNQARKLSELLVGGIHIAKANEIPS